MTLQAANKAQLRNLLSASDAGDVEGALAFQAPEYVDHDATEARQRAGGTSSEALRDAFQSFSAAFSDTRHALHDVIAEGDRVAARISVESRHTGRLWGIAPSGRLLRNDSIVIYRFVDGLIRERWCRERRTTRSLLEMGQSQLGPDALKRGLGSGDVERFYMALARLLRNYQFRDRDRQMICGITVTQCYALDFLVHEQRLTVLQLAERLALNKGNASRAVGALEAIGAVSRSRDAKNHRVRWIQPTARGRRLHDRITSGLKRVYAQRLQSYDGSFVRRVAGLLDDLADLARRQ